MEDLKKIIMLIGLPGSGKTYWVSAVNQQINNFL